MTPRLDNLFERLRSARRKALVAYIVAGDPNLAFSARLLHQLEASGVDIIELGMPFSDPMSEGPVIQRAHERALASGARLEDSLNLIADFRRAGGKAPVVLMGYANPIEHRGYQAFAQAASEATADGLLLVDMPPEDGGDLRAALAEQGIQWVCLSSPTTSPQRIPEIVAACSGYLYYVGVKGITGAGHLNAPQVAAEIGALRGQVGNLPIVAGFGIKDPESAASVASTSDGVVVGSALVDLLSVAAEDEDAALAALQDKLAAIRHALDSLARNPD